MCGIAGIIKKSQGRVDPADLSRMLAVQNHRGPDGAGITITHQDRIGFGHARLAIIDLATGDQPLWASDGQSVITFNGEIYDHLAHRDQLAKDGLKFNTHSDTEVILNLYRKHGLDFLQYLNGEFSFALWDAATRTFIAARDRYGVKPFFFRDTPEELLFSSEAKGLLTLPRVPRAFNPEHVVTSLVAASLQAVSPFAGTRILRPGHFLLWKDGSAEVREIEYWAPRYDKNASMPHEEAIAKVREVFQRAVKRRLVADVPVCTFLSGGLDSTLVTAEMASLIGAQKLSAFTIGFLNSEYDESGPATEIARELGVKHETLPVTMSDIADHLEDCVAQVELHLANPSSVGKFLLSRHVRDRGFKVALTGEGSDELFAGYPFFKLEAIWRRMESPDAAVRAGAAKLWKEFQIRESRSEGLLWSRTQEWKEAPRPFGFPSFLFNRTHQLASRLPELIHFEKNGIARGDGPYQRLTDDFKSAALAELDPLQASLYLSRAQLAGYVIPTLGDRVEMAHSIEGRTPFLDVELAELSFKIPPRYFLDVDTHREKKILHDALGSLLPPSAKATQKHPFFSPNWRKLYATPRGRELFETYLSDSAIDRVGLFQKPFLKKVKTLWKWAPQSSVMSRRIDALMGVTMTTRILHERLLRVAPQSSQELAIKRFDTPLAG